MGEKFPVLIGSSSCTDPTLLNPNQKFHGRVDELILFNSALSAEEITSEYLQIDQIANGDTTIFEGNSVVLEFDGSCGNVNWSPTSTLSSTGINPIATPTESTTYNLSISHGTCVAEDSVRI